MVTIFSSKQGIHWFDILLYARVFFSYFPYLWNAFIFETLYIVKKGNSVFIFPIGDGQFIEIALIFKILLLQWSLTERMAWLEKVFNQRALKLYSLFAYLLYWWFFFVMFLYDSWHIFSSTMMFTLFWLNIL